MALAKRSSRTITVNGSEYRWAVSPDSGYMWLVVELADGPGQRVEASFDYHDVVQADGRVTGQRRSVSPGVVRAVVLHALANGWRPDQGGLRPLRIDGEAVRPVE
jgi:hypothetical protein